MKSMAIAHEVDLAAPVEAVWPMLATSGGLSAWINAEVTIDARAGGAYEEHGIGELYVMRGHVVRATPHRELVLSYRMETSPEATWPVYTVVTLRLGVVNDHTRLALAHTGLENLPESYRQHMTNGFDFGWGDALRRLQVLLEVDHDAD